MLDQSAVGLSTTQKFEYTWRDIILYNLSVGAGQGELEYVYEKGLKAVPSFGVIPCLATFGTKDPHGDQPLMPTSKVEGLRKEGTLHMDHRLVIHSPIPTEGELTIEKVIRNVYDRGEKGAKIDVEIVAKDASGRALFTNTMGYLNRFAGGFGGEKPPASSVSIPQGAPKFTVEDCYPQNAPLLYRLTGDTFPLHADPEFAKRSGFDRPIVHGLCSLGYACRLLIGALFPGQPERLTSLEVQFRSVAMPRDRFALQIWEEGEGSALFRMARTDDGRAILDKGRVCWA